MPLPFLAPLIFGALASGGMGAVKAGVAASQRRKNAKLSAETARWSPWTGMTPQPIDKTNPVGDIFGGALSGAAFGQQFGGETTGFDNSLKSGDMGGMSTQSPVPGTNPDYFNIDRYNPNKLANASYKVPSWLQMGRQ